MIIGTGEGDRASDRLAWPPPPASQSLKRAGIMVGRYTQAHQIKRARWELKFLRTRLGGIIEGNTALADRFGPLLDLALRVASRARR